MASGGTTNYPVGNGPGQGGSFKAGPSGARKVGKGTATVGVGNLTDDERRAIANAWNAANGAASPVTDNPNTWQVILASATPAINIAATAVTFTA